MIPRPTFRTSPLALRTALLTAVLVGGCGPTATSSPSTLGPTASPSSTVPASAPATPGATGAASSGAPSVSPSALPSPVDPATISLSLESYAKVDGGPLAIASPRDGSGRLFVAAQDGRLWSVKDGAAASSPMLDLRGRISSGGERGLLGVAPHPRFPADPRVFVDYTDPAGDTIVSSFTVDPSNADRLDPGSEKVVLKVDQPYPNHNGGAVVFGPDGFLYVSLGDGGSGGDPQDNAENRTRLLGKILRLDVDHPADGKGYGIPADNPFAGPGAPNGARPEIWLYGLRNPWRMSFDRATGDLWIGDVGQGAWEEVDVVRAGQKGLDMGWDRREGTHCYEPQTGCPTPSDGLTDPVAEYGHDQGCTVIGGYVYRGSSQPLLSGIYTFLDYCSGRVFALPYTVSGLTEAARVGAFDAGTVAFGEDEAGELYTANLNGTISRVIAKAR